MRLVVLSDLHYPATPDADQRLAQAERQIARIDPDHIIVSGDLTNSGLAEQFVPVVAMLTRLGRDRVHVIPGNRDLPLARSGVIDGRQSESFTRFFPAVDFFHQSTAAAIVGLSSEPVIPAAALERAVTFFTGCRTSCVRLFVTHRSLLPVPRKKLKKGDLLPNAGDILDQLTAVHVDLVLCAHLHRAHTWTLGGTAHTMHVVNTPSLLDRSPKNDTGMLIIDIHSGERLHVQHQGLDGTLPRMLVDAPLRESHAPSAAIAATASRWHTAA
jgi:predicted phosphodiesterase